MAIPFYLQYFVEARRNKEFEWLVYGIGLLTLLVYGILFHWIPRFLRYRRDAASGKRSWYFGVIRIWDLFNGCFRCPLPFGKHFCFQPSLVLLGLVYLAIMASFAYAGTKDINYVDWYYVVGKRLGRIAVGNLPFLYIIIVRNDLISAVTGLSQEKLIFVHKWIGRAIWVMSSLHVALCIYYWVILRFPVMIVIPPSIFGMIAYGSQFILTWTSTKHLRRLSYEFFLVQHKVLSALMLLFVLFHNSGNRAAAILAIHSIVIDRVTSRVVAFIRSRKAPLTKKARLRLLDDSTVEAIIPFDDAPQGYNKWYHQLLPNCLTWKAGQHIFFTVNKVGRFQSHPFSVASLSESREMRLLIRKKGGFTKKLVRKLQKMRDEDEEISAFEKIYECELKVSFHGPYGTKIQPLITFDSLLFIGGGSGGSFIFPLALDLVQSIQQKNYDQDYVGRPTISKIHIVWAIRYADNICWFQNMIDKFRTFVNMGLISMDIFITQESQIEKDPSFKKGIEDISTEVEVHRVKNSIEKEYLREESSSSDTSSGELSVGSDIKLHYEALEIKYQIETEVDRIIGRDNGSSMSLAVVGCGPSSLSNNVKVECQRNRWKKGAPDIYCLTEAY